jgi:hypothetical protein
MNPVTSNALLEYSLDTLPDPLQASPEQGNIVYGALSIVISNGGNAVVNLSQLQFTLPTGSLAQELTSDPGAILWATSPGNLWHVTMTSPGVFLLVPQSGNPVPVSTDGMVIQFYNIPVNQQVGTVAITVTETATSSSSPAEARTAVFNAAKFPYGFYFANLTAQVPMVQEGSSVTLTWQGSDNATYSIQWNEEPAVDVTNVRSWTSPVLSNDTTFLLKATVVSQGETVFAYLSTTVIVANPELQASSLQVTGATNLQGATTIGTGSTQATVNGNLTVNGATLLSGSTTLSGSTVAGNVAVNGNLSSGTSATFNDVAINGTLAAIKGAQGFDQGTYTAKTDGIVVAYISSGGAPPGNYCQGYIIATMPYGTFWLSGGNYTSPGYYYNGGSMMSLPLAKGQSCSIAFQNSSANQNNPARQMSFLPLGSIPQDSEMLVKVSDDVPEFDLPEAVGNVDDQAESIASALLEAVRGGKVEQLTEVVKHILARR